MRTYVHYVGQHTIRVGLLRSLVFRLIGFRLVGSWKEKSKNR